MLSQGRLLPANTHPCVSNMTSTEQTASRRFHKNRVSPMHPRHVKLCHWSSYLSYQPPLRSSPSIPANVLYRICLAVQDGQGDALDRKHQKSLDIVAMMDVSRSWRDGIAGFDDLFRDIAFDTSNGRMIVTATRVLQTIETKATELRVFIRSTFRDLIRDTKLHVIATELLLRLGRQSSRFTYFELQGRSSHLGPYFNLPAPKLRLLRCDCTMSHVLFSSSFPDLRKLCTHVKKTIRILPSTLFNLVELQLINAHRTQIFSMESVLAILHSARQLEVLQLSGFVQFNCTSATAEPTELGRLKSVQFTDCHLPEILPRLRFPRLRRFGFHGFGSIPDENTPPSMVGDTNFFSPLRACLLPILDQRALTHIIISTDDKVDKIEFTLRLMSGPPGPRHQFVITMSWEKWAGSCWEEYLEQSIREAMGRIRFSSNVCLYLFHHVDNTQLLCSPLLRLPQVSMLCTSGWFTPAALKLLIGSSDPTIHSPLPRLKCFCFRGDDLRTSPDEIQSLAELCLQSRFDRRQPLAIRRWIPCGNLMNHPPLEPLNNLVLQAIQSNG